MTIGLIALATALWIGLALTSDSGELPTLFDITDDPQEFAGETVTVSGEVNMILDEKAMLVGQTAGDDEGVLVIVPEGPPDEASDPEALPFQADDIVLVTGEVRIFTPEDFAARDLAVAADLMGELEQRPAIVAESIDLTNRPK